MRTYFFYDLETSGFNARYDRIMQFAGQRTTLELEPTGEPVNILVKMTDDTLPSPGAILTTHITPQQTLQDGISEADFCREFLANIATPDTIFIGYNNIRFDDEFMRHTLWRNFHDPYEWAWKEGRGRWDMLDVARMVRALRPDDITWPNKRMKDEKTGEWHDVPTVNLVDMAKNNGFENENAHDALADVNALINLTRLLRDKQPQMFNYLKDNHTKDKVAGIVRPDAPMPFVYTSGRFPSENEKTTVATAIASGKTSSSVLVWDLRYKITNFDWDTKQIRQNLMADYETRHQDGFVALPIKELSFNKCPAVAPIGVLNEEAEKRVHLTKAEAIANWHLLHQNKEILQRITSAWRGLPALKPAADVEGRLYDSFAPDSDKTKIRLVAAASESDLADMHPEFNDKRLDELLLRYKARQYPKTLSETEQQKWEQYRITKLQRELPKYFEQLNKLSQQGVDDYILQELQLWAESLIPAD